MAQKVVFLIVVGGGVLVVSFILWPLHMPPFFDVCQPGRQDIVTRAYFWHANVLLVCTGTCHYMLQLFGVIAVLGKRVLVPKIIEYE